MWPFHQTKRIPPIDEMKPANPNAIHAVERDVVAERAHAHRVVAHALQRQAERRAHEVAQQREHEHREHERDVVEAVRVRVGVADDVRRRDAADAAEARELRDLAEEQVRDHAERERDHEEVDADAARGERAEDERDARCRTRARARRPIQGFQPRSSPFVFARRRVAEREACDAVDRDLGERDHAAVGREERQAGRDDAEQQHLREQRADPVGAHEQRAPARRRAARSRPLRARSVRRVMRASRRCRAAAPRAPARAGRRSG